MSSIEQKNTINAILSYLEMTYKSNDNEKRKQAEEKLKEFQNYILRNLSESFILLKSNTISKDLSNSLMLYIKNIIIAQKKKETLNNNIIENIIQSLIVCLLDVEFPSKYQIEMNKCSFLISQSKESLSHKVVGTTPILLRISVNHFKDLKTLFCLFVCF